MDKNWRALPSSLPGEGVEEPGPLSLGEGHPHPRHERRMQDDRADLVSRREVDRGHGTDALSVQNNVLRTDAVAGAQRVPRGVDIRVEVLLRRLAARDPVTRIVVTEYVAVYPRAEPEVEARHLAEVDGVAVGEEDGEARGRRATYEQACYAIPPRRPRVETLDRLLLALRVLPLGALRQGDGELGALVLDERVRRLGRQERQLVGDSRRAGRTAEQAAQFTET